MESRRLNLLDSHLGDLEKHGFIKLVGNFLSDKNQYTIRPFLFEIYICRWLLSQESFQDIVYEPDDMEKPPEFVFRINDQIFQIEAKVISQLINETVKKKLVSQINRQISSKTNNVIEIWLSEGIEPKDINRIVDWIVVESVSLDIGDKKVFTKEGETYAWIKTISKSKTGGIVVIEHFVGKADGDLQEIDTENIKDKILAKIKKANKKFRHRSGENIYNFLFVTCDSNIFLTKETFQEALYGSEAIVSYQDTNGEYQTKEVLQGNGIWSGENYTNIDLIVFIKSGTDFLEDVFDPYVFPNPFKIKKLKKIYEPFYSMKTHLPPTMLGQSIFGY
ncbi:MAG: hypothetical protein ACXACY_22130 [Candidatus Hodarchaeales archaeon]